MDKSKYKYKQGRKQQEIREEHGGIYFMVVNERNKLFWLFFDIGIVIVVNEAN